jgi:two-component system NtrC family sensor kinase
MLDPSAASASPLKTVGASGRSRPPWLENLRIERRFLVGYGLAIGIAIAGTTLGGVVAQGQSRRAWQQHDRVETQRSHLAQYHIHLLSIQSHIYAPTATALTPQGAQELWDDLANHSSNAARTRQALQDWATTATLDGRSPLYAIQQDWQRIEQRSSTAMNLLLDVMRRRSQSALDNFAEEPEAFDAAQQRQLLANLREQLSQTDLTPVIHDLQALIKTSDQILEATDQRARRLSGAWWLIFGGSSVISALIAAVLGARISRSIAEPVQTMAEAARQITESENFEQRVPVVGGAELADLAIAFNAAIARVNDLMVEQRRSATEQLVASEKLSSLGRMLAEVAHELNNPINYIYGNIPHCKAYVKELFDLLSAYEEELDHPSAALEDLQAEIDRDFLEQDLQKLISSMEIGAQRSRQIVLSLKNSSRIDEEEPQPVDVHDSLEGALAILYNRLKKGITVERQFGAVPRIEGFSGSLYQVFSNLIGNAIDALNEHDGPEKCITIATERLGGDQIAIRIRDTGGGIPEAVRDRIFDPFFTTKPSGIGTGLGLPIVKQLVEEKHGGQLVLESSEGQGTEFTIILPIRQMAALPSPVA